MTTWACWVIAGKSFFATTFLLILLGIKIPGNEMLEIYYPAEFLHLNEGDSLVLTCKIRYQPHQSQGLDVYWCRQTEKSSACDRVDKELEKRPLNRSSVPKENETLYLLLQIHQLTQSDSGNYQCRGATSNPVQYSMGHYIRVHITATQPSVNNSSQANTTQNGKDHFWREPGSDFHSNKALQMAFQLEKIVMLSLILVLIAIKTTF